MAEENWRTVKKDGWKKKDNWRNREGSNENRHFSTSSGFSRDSSNVQRNSTNPFNSTTSRPIGLHGILKDDFKSDNLLNQHFLYNLSENQNIEEITTFLISNMDDYTRTLASNISDELLIALLKLAAKACENSFVTSKTYMLKSTLQKKFVSTICAFLSGLVMDDKKDARFWQTFGNILNDLLIILENAMQFIPITLWEQIQTIIKTVTLVLPVLQKDKEITLTGDFDNRMTILKNNILKIENKFRKLESTGIPNVINNEIEQNDPEDDYRFIDLYPNSQELTILERPFLRKNIVRGKYNSLEHYLDIHFRLMREDFLNPIREDICDYLNNTKRRLFNIIVHNNVVFRKRDVQRNTLCFEIALKVSPALQNMLKTGQNKRLMHGTLLFFSSDNFKSIFCGKVVGNDELKNSILLVNLPYYDAIDYTTNYSMIECVIFFEPYYQVLKVLQTISQNQLPMEKYILCVETNISHPKYMENVRSLKFPSGLNPSQIEALHASLNKEFVIIQGPPGTGKTFLGRTLVKMLLDQKQIWKESGPILVVCFTNHALEQFLNGLSQFTDKLVRLGRNSIDLRSANLEYGPEGQLKTYLEKHYDIYEGDDPEFNLKFRRFVNYLTRDYSHRWVSYTEFDYFDSIDISLLPTKIIKWLRQKARLGKIFTNIKEIEREIKDTKSKLENVFNNEKAGILFEIIQENVVEYYFQNIELFCWLLCEDVTISLKQDNKFDGPFENSDVEQERIYVLLCNFVLGQSTNLNYYFGEDFNNYGEVLNNYGEDLNNYLSVSALEQAAYELRNYLNSEDVLIKQTDRRYLNEQLDFLLKKIDYLKFCLETDFGPPEVEFADFPDPFMIRSNHRWQLYKQWYEMYKIKLRQSLQKLSNTYQRYYDNYNDLREMDNVKLLREMDVVGMTTTCAARLRSTLEALKCPIVIVEEAAEILESHIVTALTKDCQHLILLGDHQQLKPKTSDYTIEKKYKLGISLFERMVQNNVECHTLNVQHRMRPEISSLITPLFYKELFNHQSVEIYPSVFGIDHPLYFIDHMEPEELYGDSGKMNMHEAKFLIQLAIYLLNNNHEPEDITILAAYRGQSYVLRKEQEISLHPTIREVRIAVVDNFQGEESNIILLSLVRSNSENNVGFLSIENRVCVALSRAKVGLYIMGNMTQLCEATDVWKSIRATLESQQAIGRYLPLRCKNHKEHVTLASKATDFAKVPEGGCNQTCNAILNCGHTCFKLCHGYDVNHELYICKEPCTRWLCDNEEHQCKKQCFQTCGSCPYPVNRKLLCGHDKSLACSTDLDTYKCKELIKTQLDCGHLQNVPCFSKAKMLKTPKEVETNCNLTQNTEIRCNFKIEKVFSECGHTQMVPCFKDAAYKCQFEMEITLKCGHMKKKQCYLAKDMVTCSVVCDTQLKCGHRCVRECHIDDDPNHIKYECKEPCTKNLKGCNNTEIHPKCNLLCYKTCPPCAKLLMKSYTGCSHIEKLECYNAPETRLCRRPCNKKLPCGHRCEKKCFEVCSSCKQTTFKKIAECGHKMKLKCAETPNQKNCIQPCTKTLGCGHSCTKRCNEPCNTVCLKRCQKILDCRHNCIRKCNENCACKTEIAPKCGHTILIKCGDEVTSEKCEKPCRKLLDCGHYLVLPCNKSILDVICEQQSPKTLACGHTNLGRCSMPEADITCIKRCEKLLECSHKCSKMCCEPCNKKCAIN